MRRSAGPQSSKNMSQLEQKINDDLKQAMRAKDELGVSVRRLLLSAVKNKAIALRQGEAVALTEEQVIEVLASEAKKRQDAIESYRSAGREELAAKEQAELALLETYLPAQLEPAEVEAAVKAIVDQAENRAFGPIMAKAMAELKGRADGKLVGETVKRLLA